MILKEYIGGIPEELNGVILAKLLIIPVINAKKRWESEQSAWWRQIYFDRYDSLVMVYGNEQVDRSVEYWM